jgi:hypothetical protein
MARWFNGKGVIVVVAGEFSAGAPAEVQGVQRSREPYVLAASARARTGFRYSVRDGELASAEYLIQIKYISCFDRGQPKLGRLFR